MTQNIALIRGGELRYDTSCLSVANHAGEPERCKYSKGSGTERFKVIKAAGLVAGVPSRMRGDMANLLHASLANSTWKKYGSAWAALDGYQHHIETPPVAATAECYLGLCHLPRVRKEVEVHNNQGIHFGPSLPP